MEINLSYQQFKKSRHFACIDNLSEVTQQSPRQLFEVTVHALNHAFGGMEPEFKYKTKDIFEESDWNNISDGAARSLGICLSYLASNDLIPLEYANRPRSTNKLYRLKPGVNPAACSFRVC